MPFPIKKVILFYEKEHRSSVITDLADSDPYLCISVETDAVAGIQAGMVQLAV